MSTVPGMLVHWFFSGQELCEEYVTGDDVIDATTGTLGDVDCTECLEWIHA